MIYSEHGVCISEEPSAACRRESSVRAELQDHGTVDANVRRWTHRPL